MFKLYFLYRLGQHPRERLLTFTKYDTSKRPPALVKGKEIILGRPRSNTETEITFRYLAVSKRRNSSQQCTDSKPKTDQEWQKVVPPKTPKRRPLLRCDIVSYI